MFLYYSQNVMLKYFPNYSLCVDLFYNVDLIFLKFKWIINLMALKFEQLFVSISKFYKNYFFVPRKCDT